MGNIGLVKRLYKFAWTLKVESMQGKPEVTIQANSDTHYVQLCPKRTHTATLPAKGSNLNQSVTLPSTQIGFNPLPFSLMMANHCSVKNP